MSVHELDGCRWSTRSVARWAACRRAGRPGATGHRESRGRCNWRHTPWGASLGAGRADHPGFGTGRPWSTIGIRDASLCHGSAGVLHILSLVARDATSPAAVEPLIRLVRAHLDTFVDPESRFDVRTVRAHWAGVLDGAAGVALVLRGTPPAATTLTWDAALLLA
ncbi:lanthionine synthetase LanC family protein [Micromonospora sp. WMMD729]|uniref:lanthionine synthetase LanC family protein n=1 Tax=Micromonospora sp. WMMD729 TaxID=3404127 RepID=UPI003BF53CD1